MRLLNTSANFVSYPLQPLCVGGLTLEVYSIEIWFQLSLSFHLFAQSQIFLKREQSYNVISFQFVKPKVRRTQKEVD